MKNVVHQLSIALLALLVIVTGCKKDDVIQKPGNGGGNPGNGQTTNAFRIVVDSLPGAIMPIYGLHAMFSIVNDQDQEVVVDRKMALNYAGKYATDTLKLDPKTYKIKKLWIRNEKEQTLFAAPLMNSLKASEVDNPLPFSFVLPKPTISNISIQVAKVAATDKPADFGYTSGSFNNGDGSEVPASFVKIKIQPKIRIGEVVYDSIPVAIHIRTIDKKGEETIRVVSLRAGINEITLDRSARSYRIILSKWGTMDELQLSPADVQEGTIYVLGGSREAKLLQSELIYKFENNVYKPVRKQSYYYNGGKLSEIKYFGKKADNTTYLEMTDNFRYNSLQKVSTIRRTGENSQVILTTEFTYDQAGRISGTKEINSDQTITGVVSYAPGSGIDGIDGDYNVHVRYRLSLSGHTLDYNQVYKGGNRIWDNAVTSNQTSETGSHQYDVSINPYIHMNWPDVFLSRNSKHNMVASARQFYGSYQTAVPFKFEYTYDVDGYPKEVITHYQDAFGKFMFKTKTVYNY